MKTAWVFPGQGSQAMGMGVDLATTPIGKDRFEEAKDILGWSVLDKCQGDETELAKTLYTQPCLYVVESLLIDLLKDKGQKVDLVAGHSLGEYSALYAAEVFEFATGLTLVKRRAELMSEAAGGKMVALMKFDRSQLEEAIVAIPDVVLANDNSEQQVVISGTPEAVDQLCSQVKTKRAIPLKVSGAFHSPMMAEAADKFKQLLEEANFSEAKVPVLSNVDPTPTISATILKERLTQQMIRSVRWREIMLALPQQEITNVLEVGPGKVLTGLIKRACSEVEVNNVGSLNDF
ncbi:ACP S-malonyltransferase [Crocosphaera chwakensis]|uniref:Malonyl CoA-acyl carrier protein transacylase n=1 Tax=Crocosphaera chwakensis CCY0110 TaxID=391612 RepID=A3IXE8_9CHRO|nr:ACP S-malonyltransferase [Crocosphaera chwakensis]EAZ88843.1 acyl-carrier-protein S-malonyltransferase [Crocosphaera chwakensis CCY0110]